MASKKPNAAPSAAPTDPRQILRLALAEPFHADEINWKPQAISKDKTKALAVAFINARAVMDRLDDVVGPLGWQDDYETHPDGSVTCRLSLKDGVEWVTKQDVGGESEQPDRHDKRKAAFSDALKRAGVQWGIGRYLYHLPKQWCDYDDKKRQFIRTPTLPAWALPGAKTPPPPPAPEPPAPEEPQPTATVIVGGQHVAGPAPTVAPPGVKGSTPEGIAFHGSLVDYDSELVKDGLPCEGGDLILYVKEKGKGAKFPADVVAWKESELKVARGWIKEFEKTSRRALIKMLMLQTSWTMEDVRVEIELPDDATLENMSLLKLKETIGVLRGAVAEAA